MSDLKKYLKGQGYGSKEFKAVTVTLRPDQVERLKRENINVSMLFRDLVDSFFNTKPKAG